MTFLLCNMPFLHKLCNLAQNFTQSTETFTLNAQDLHILCKRLSSLVNFINLGVQIKSGIINLRCASTWKNRHLSFPRFKDGKNEEKSYRLGIFTPHPGGFSETAFVFVQVFFSFFQLVRQYSRSSYCNPSVFFLLTFLAVSEVFPKQLLFLIFFLLFQTSFSTHTL